MALAGENGLSTRYVDVLRSNDPGRRSVPVAFKGGTERVLSEALLETGLKKQSRARLVDLLRECSDSKDLSRGKQVHADILGTSYFDDALVGNWIVQMYLKCGSLADAKQVFDQVVERRQVNLVVWTSMIAAYARCGQTKAALQLFAYMQLEGVTPDRITLVTVFEVCGSPANLEDGKRIQAYVPCEFDVVLGSCAITMYGKCGSVEDARLMFQEMKQLNEVTWNSLMGAYVQNGHEEEALELYWHMLQKGFVPSRATFVTVLGACANLEALQNGKQVHSSLAEDGYDNDVIVQSALVNMYGKCGSLDDALEMFERMPRHDVILWSSIISASVSCGENKEAFKHFQKMQLEGNKPNPVTLVNVLSACDGPDALEAGRGAHELTVEAGCSTDLIVGNAIVSMYGRCGSLEEAWSVFHDASQRSVVTCNGMMGACALLGDSLEALKLVRHMLQEGIEFDNVTFVNAFGACSNSPTGGLSHGEFFHSLMVERGIQPDIIMANALVNMYGKCGQVDAAYQVFREFPEQDVRTWNAMILAHVQNGQEERGLTVFRYMMQNGFKPDEVTFAVTLNACQRPAALTEVHLLVTETGITNSVVENALVVMYGRLGLLEEAFQVFETLDHGNITAWNVMIAACTQFGHMEEGFKLFRMMQLQGVIPNKGTLLIMLNGSSTSLQAKALRGYLTDELLESHKLLKLALVNLYGRCATSEETLEIFQRLESPPTSSWNAVLSSLVQDGRDVEALKLFWKMQQAGATPDKSSFLSIIKAYTNLGITDSEASWLERSIVDCALDDVPVLGNAFIGLFAKYGSLSRAREVFDRMSERDVVSWNTMMNVSDQLHQGRETIQLFRLMLQEGKTPDKITVLTVLNVCTSFPAFREGRSIHAWLLAETSLWSSQKIANAVLNMYAKCGSREEARRVFGEMQARDSVSWNALLGAYGNYSRGKYTLELFREMQLEGVPPDEVTFTSILALCSHGGLLSEGIKWFCWMREDFYVEPVTGHYGCIVDLLGRMGKVAEAEDITDSMPVTADSVMWTTLLGACKVHGDADRGKRVGEMLVKSDPKITSSYVMLSSLFRVMER